MGTIKIKIGVGEQSLIATLLDNATSRSFISMLPLSLPMMNLYSRELVYRFTNQPLPANEAKTSGYQVGDISYWTPGRSFVIFYKQNGEIISNLQPVGRIDSGVDIFKNTDNVEVKFELINH